MISSYLHLHLLVSLIFILSTPFPHLIDASPRSFSHALSMPLKVPTTELSIPAISPPPPPATAPTPSTLHPRNAIYYAHHNRLPLGWTIYYTTFTQVLPSAALIQHLDLIYRNIIFQTQTTLSHHPELHLIVLDIGLLQMVFRRDTRPIPWQFIISFVQTALSQLIGGGFSGFYAAMLSHAATDDEVFVTLGLNPVFLTGRTGVVRAT